MTDLTRRRTFLAGSAALGGNALLRSATATAAPAQARASQLTPGDFLAPDGGTADAQPALQRMVDQAAALGIPAVISGVYRLDSPLSVRSNVVLTGSGTLRANHAGALITGGEDIVARVEVDGLRLEAQQAAVAFAIQGTRWQYSRLSNLRLIGAGGHFSTGIWFDNVAYWNTVRGLEAESVLDLFDLGDANNLVLDDINWCRFTDIGMRRFIRFHAPCSAVYGTALSIEGVFRRQTLITLLPGCSDIQLEFLRVEGRSGSHNTGLIDFNGSTGNRLKLSGATFGIGGPVLRHEDGNVIEFQSRTGHGASRLGLGEVVLPISKEDPSVAGSINFNTSGERIRTFVRGARSVALSPAIEPLEMGEQAITGCSGLTLSNGDRSMDVRLFVDADGRLSARFANGAIRKISGLE